MAKCNLKAQISPVSDAWIREIVGYSRLVEQQYGLPVGMLDRMMNIESKYDPAAFNPCTNAIGIVQQRPIFVRDLATRPVFKNYVFDPLNPKTALIAAAKYLTFIYKLTRQSGWDLPLIAYNAGEGNMKAFLKAKALYGNAELKDETVKYVAFIAPDSFRG